MECVKSILVAEEINSSVESVIVQKNRIRKVKEELKEDAKNIKSLRRDCKSSQRGDNKGPYVYQDQVHSASYEWRHKHLAYCMLRGRTYEEIERTCREDNKPYQRLIEKYKNEILNG